LAQVSRTPVHVVAGEPGADTSGFVGRMLAARPDWAHIAPRGCPCCSARVDTQRALTRMLREQRPRRVLIELPDEQHLGALRRALNEWPLSQYIELRRTIRLPQDDQLAPEALGA
jgi:hypothetical protein